MVYFSLSCNVLNYQAPKSHFTSLTIEVAMHGKFTNRVRGRNMFHFDMDIRFSMVLPAIDMLIENKCQMYNLKDSAV